MQKRIKRLKLYHLQQLVLVHLFVQQQSFNGLCICKGEVMDNILTRVKELTEILDKAN